VHAKKNVDSGRRGAAVVILVRSEFSECGGSTPLLLAATSRGEGPTADESAVEKAGPSSRTPKFRPIEELRIGEADAAFACRDESRRRANR
jgi:hypothetical protein